MSTREMMSGQCILAVDHSGRISLPRQFCSAFSEVAWLLEREDHLVLADRLVLSKVLVVAPEATAVETGQYAICSSWHEVVIDSRWRITLPARVRGLVHPGSTCAVLGCGQYLEIWDVDMFEQARAKFIRDGEFDILFGYCNKLNL